MAKGFQTGGLDPARRKAAFARGTDKSKGGSKGLLGGLGPARAGFRPAALPKMPGMPPGPKKGGW
jgi:hypothetical protein